MTRSRILTLASTAACALGLLATPLPAAGARGRAVQPVPSVSSRPQLPSVVGAFGSAERRDRAVTGEVNETCVLQSIKCNTTVNSTLTSQDCQLGDGTVFDFWQFAGVAGASVTINLSSTAFDPYLFLLDPDGFSVAEDDDSGPGSNARILYTLDSSGIWNILANNFSPASVGNYSLMLQCSAVSPPPAAPSNLAAFAVNSSTILLTWQDNSGNETEFRIEQMFGGAWLDLGGVDADSVAAVVTGATPETMGTFRVRARNPEGDSGPSNEASATTLAAAQPCVPGATTLCIDDAPGDRLFEIRVSYQTAQGGGGAGPGLVTPLASLGITQGGVVSFFSATNPELLIKVLNVCFPPFDRYWVFYSAGTNVGFAVIVRKTDTDDANVYINRDGDPAPPVQDTGVGFDCN